MRGVFYCAEGKPPLQLKASSFSAQLADVQSALRKIYKDTEARLKDGSMHALYVRAWNAYVRVSADDILAESRYLESIPACKDSFVYDVFLPLVND